jgi:hypothetical protein
VIGRLQLDFVVHGGLLTSKFPTPVSSYSDDRLMLLHHFQ